MKKPHHDSNRRKIAAPLVAAVLSAAALASIGTVEPKSATTTKQSVSAKEIVLPVEGMTCVVCVVRVKKELSAMPGVAAVTVDLVERAARISFDPKRVSAKELAATVDKLGYKAGEPRDAPKRERK